MNFVIHKFLSTILLLGVLLSFITPALAATLASSVDRNKVNINETITLTVNFDEQVDSSALDLRSLANDFEIISNRPQSSSSITTINGQTESKSVTTWTIVLVPKRVGKLTIPAFTLGNASSQSISIEVSESNNTGQANTPLIAFISADTDSAYPGQQVVIEVELSANANVRDLNGEQILLDGADIEVLDQQSFQRNDNGVIRQIIVLKYALFPSEPGSISIPALTFNGVEGGGRRSIFDRRAPGRRVVARTEPMQIDVLAIPDKANAAWFTAKNVIITSQWSAEKSQAKVGEPLTRTIQIIANGQRASAIPPLNTNDSAVNYKAYADQPQLNNQKTIDGYTGTRTESQAIVPSVEGIITLPEHRLNWWNTKSQSWEVAILPAEELTVAANSAVASNFNASSAQSQTHSPVINTTGNTHHTSNNFWKIATLFLSVVTALQFIMLFKLNRQQSRITKPQENHNESSYWSALQQQLKSQDIMAVRKAIIDWANAAIPNQTISSLHALYQADKNTQLKPLLSALDEHLYKQEAQESHNDISPIDLSELAQHLQSLRSSLNQQRNTKASEQDLAPLYPQ